jgi:pimeloyl-ACP methyl ester carboxylesterase
MTRLLHARGDTLGMFLLFLIGFLGIWQLIVAFKRLNGLSLTGYPDRKKASVLIGVLLIAGICGWYFSGKRHFAYPDVEGTETFLLLIAGLASATLIQIALSSIMQSVFRKDMEDSRRAGREESLPQRLPIPMDGARIPSFFWQSRSPAPGSPVLLLHDYGGRPEDVAPLAEFLAERGHQVLAPCLDGHAESPSAIASPAMEGLLDRAASALKRVAGVQSIAAVGIGFGATLALNLASRDQSVGRTVAVDPPAQEDGGAPRINVLRESKAGDVIKAFFRPAARIEGKRSAACLARLLEQMPPPHFADSKGVTVMGSAGVRVNSPSSLREFASLCGLDDPTLIACDHASMTSNLEVFEATARSLADEVP